VVAPRFADALTGGSAAEFSTPDQECVFPQSGSLEICHQRCDGLIGLTRVKLVVCNAVVVAVPRVFYEFQQALRLVPNDRAAQHNLGLALMQKADYNAAIATYRQLLALTPDDAEAHYNLGLALKYKDDLPAAVAAFRRSLELQPGLPEAHYSLGVTLLQQGQTDAAIAAFRGAIAAKPDFAEAYYTLGTALQQRGELDAAVPTIREAIRLVPLSPQVHNTLGTALRQRGELDAARGEFAEAARLNKLKTDNQAAIFATNTGIQKLKEGKLAQAIERFEAAIRLDQNYGPAHYQLGFAWQKRGKRAAARAAFARAQELDPRLRAPAVKP
jgi:tetratricopeptide (TPR) repeat protein